VSYSALQKFRAFLGLFLCVRDAPGGLINRRGCGVLNVLRVWGCAPCAVNSWVPDQVTHALGVWVWGIQACSCFATCSHHHNKLGALATPASNWRVWGVTFRAARQKHAYADLHFASLSNTCWEALYVILSGLYSAEVQTTNNILGRFHGIG